MDDIDSLRGHALNCAVAQALGWKQDPKHGRWWDVPDGKSWHVPFDDDPPTRIDRLFDPAHRIQDAWTLGEERLWAVMESRTHTACWCAETLMTESRCQFIDFVTKNEARATARTIAWLKTQLMPCGHPRSAVVGDVTLCCGECAKEK